LYAVGHEKKEKPFALWYASPGVIASKGECGQRVTATNPAIAPPQLWVSA
jgi:hypothetical protein